MADNRVLACSCSGAAGERSRIVLDYVLKWPGSGSQGEQQLDVAAWEQVMDGDLIGISTGEGLAGEAFEGMSAGEAISRGRALSWWTGRRDHLCLDFLWLMNWMGRGSGAHRRVRPLGEVVLHLHLGNERQDSKQAYVPVVFRMLDGSTP
jgi:hypothetical protein